MESLQVPEQLSTEAPTLSENVDIVKKAKRVLSEKQREALKAGREKRWKRMFEALENQTEQQHKSNEETTYKDPLLEDTVQALLRIQARAMPHLNHQSSEKEK